MKLLHALMVCLLLGMSSAGEEDLCDVRAGNTHYLEVGMTNNGKMVIVLIVI